MGRLAALDGYDGKERVHDQHLDGAGVHGVGDQVHVVGVGGQHQIRHPGQRGIFVAGDGHDLGDADRHILQGLQNIQGLAGFTDGNDQVAGIRLGQNGRHHVVVGIVHGRQTQLRQTELAVHGNAAGGSVAQNEDPCRLQDHPGRLLVQVRILQVHAVGGPGNDTAEDLPLDLRDGVGHLDVLTGTVEYLARQVLGDLDLEILVALVTQRPVKPNNRGLAFNICGGSQVGNGIFYHKFGVFQDEIRNAFLHLGHAVVVSADIGQNGCGFRKRAVNWGVGHKNHIPKFLFSCI